MGLLVDVEGRAFRSSSGLDPDWKSDADDCGAANRGKIDDTNECGRIIVEYGLEELVRW